MQLKDLDPNLANSITKKGCGRLNPASRLLTAQFFKYLGEALLEIAWIVWVLHLAPDHPALSLGTLMALQAVPQAAFSGILSGYIDRMPRKFTLIITSLVEALAIGMTALFPVLWATFLLLLVFKTCSVVSLPIERAVLPDLVSDRAAINKIMARLGQIYAISQAIGLAGVGFLILLITVTHTFFVIGAVYLITALAYGLTPVPTHKTASRSSWWEQIKEGLMFHRQNVAVRYLLFIIGLSGFVLGGINTLLTLSTSTLWHHPSHDVNYIFLALLLGVLASDTLLSHWLNESRYHLTILLSLVLIMLAAFAIGFTTGSWLFGILMAFIMGVANGFILTPSRAWLASVVASEMRGRVMAFRSQVLGVVTAISPYLTAILVVNAGLTTTWIVVASFLVALALWWLLTKPISTATLVTQPNTSAS
ncbi:MAG: hypothetical protein C7B46_05360 [Sulfobacillus benefaciens]|uniref:Major facilitator superfamily (MFS) profile domain-containing protein n=1 Tax=Sulfobacillus benefaciens TaxID=453960 RepID=A0A2T2XJ99_9FIRM|nr:MAG: hypothetical protein C7B46_05360 [Sulfobacillus benefaciens]